MSYLKKIVYHFLIKNSIFFFYLKFYHNRDISKKHTRQKFLGKITWFGHLHFKNL